MTTGQQLAIDGQDDTLAAATLAHIRHLDDVRGRFEWWVKWSGLRSHEGFTAEEVRGSLQPETVAWLDSRPNILPAMFGAASRAKRITCIGRQRATRPSRHANEIRIWKGNCNA